MKQTADRRFLSAVFLPMGIKNGQTVRLTALFLMSPRSGRVNPIKTCTNGRWVASVTLYCFQLPAKGREACKPRLEGASRFRNVGLKGPITHRAG